MASFFGRKKDPTARAERVSRAGEGAGERVVDAEIRSKIILGLAMIAVFLVLMEFIFPAAVPGSGIDISVGKVAGQDIVAPFNFVELKPLDDLELEREMEVDAVEPVFVLDGSVQAEQRRRLGEFLDKVYEVRTGPESVRQKREMLGQLTVALSDTARNVLVNDTKAGRVEDSARTILGDLYEAGVLRLRGSPVRSPDDTVLFLAEDKESIARVHEFISLDNVASIIEREAARSFDERGMVVAVRELVLPFVRGNVIHDAGETQGRKAAARDSVSEFTGRDFAKDEVIVEEGERITQEHENIIRSMGIKREKLLNLEPGLSRFFPQIGRILQAILLLGTLVLYLSVRRGGMLLDTRCQLLFMVLVLIVTIGAAAVRGFPSFSEYLVPIAVLAMMASMLFDFEVAVVSTLITVLLAAVYTGFGLPFVMVSFIAGTVAAHSVREVRHREDFYLSGIRVVAAYAVAIFVADTANADIGMATLTRCGWGGLNALVSMGIVIVTLPLFERGFRVTTDITLLELADMNRPLLRKMAMSSPGTYHHSIVVGNLSEAAAKAIGANGLLARVASYYHDIGKLVAPGYFVENQQGLEPDDSKHTTLKPKVSSLVIRAHVKDGVELAAKEGLPQPLIDVINEHHGTSAMEYFYNKAVEEAEAPDDINKADYSYPGPRPRSRESAIIALADTIEARVRSIGESITPKRIEAEIEEVIEKRWHDHQLDDAELTLSDLRKIREAFFRVLAGMYHQRIRYPDQENGSDESGQANGTRAAEGDPGADSGPERPSDGTDDASD